MKARIKSIGDATLKCHYKIGDILEVEELNEAIYRCVNKGFWFLKSELEFLHQPKTDPIVETVVNKFLSRSAVGIEKYGTTLHENNLSVLEWLNHAQEEAMDFCLYLQKLKEEINEIKNPFLK